MNPLTTIYRNYQDYNGADGLNESFKLFEREKKIEDFLDGKISEDELLSLLESQDFNIDDYLKEVEENLIIAESILPNINYLIGHTEIGNLQFNYFPHVDIGIR